MSKGNSYIRTIPSMTLMILSYCHRPLNSSTLPAWRYACKAFLSYVFDICSTVLLLLRKPLAWLIFLSILITLCGYLLKSMLLNPGYPPLCVIPGIASLPACTKSETSRLSNDMRGLDSGRLCVADVAEFDPGSDLWQASSAITQLIPAVVSKAKSPVPREIAHELTSVANNIRFCEMTTNNLTSSLRAAIDM
jgi:hypothetical protein